MTRSNRVRGALALVTCLGAAVALVVLLPGKGASAREDAQPCTASSSGPAASGGAPGRRDDAKSHRPQQAGKGPAGKGPAGKGSVPRKQPAPSTGAGQDDGLLPCLIEVIVPSSSTPNARDDATRRAPGLSAPTGAAAPTEPSLPEASIQPGEGHISGAPPGREPGPLPSSTSPGGSTPAPTSTSTPAPAPTGSVTAPSEPAGQPTRSGSTTPPTRPAPTTSVATPALPPLTSVPASQTNLTRIPQAAPTPTSTEPGPTSTEPATPTPPTSSSSPGRRVEVAAKSAVGANDSLLLAGLLLGFTVAVTGVVMAAGRRGQHRRR